MAEHLIDRLRKKLAPGYTLERVQAGAGSGVYEVIDPEGHRVRDVDSQYPIRFADKQQNQNQIESALRRVGAIPEPRPRRSEPRAAAASKKPEAKTNPVLMARTILRDPQATGRERQMARAYLDLLESHKKVKELAQRLGQVLRERQDDE